MTVPYWFSLSPGSIRRMGAFVAVEEMIVEKCPSPRIEKPWTTGMSSVSEILYVPWDEDRPRAGGVEGGLERGRVIGEVVASPPRKPSR